MATILSEFKGLPVEDLIAGPLTAACDAQVRLANATADFIKVIGFQPPTAEQLTDDPNAVGAPRTVSFSFTRPTPAIPADNTTDPVTPAQPAGTETVVLTVPQLAIVKVPALSVTNVNIVFDMEVKSSSSTKSSTDEALSASVDASGKWGGVKVNVHIQGSVATHKENTRTTDNSAKYHFEVTAQDNGMPEGLKRVLDIMNSAIVPVVAPPPHAP